MRVRNALIAGYLAQSYVVLAGVIALPGFLQVVTPEVFGLMGIFLMLQGWAQLFDFGVPAVISREFSLSKNSSTDRDRAWSVFRVLGSALWALGAVVAFLLSLGAEWVADNWLAQSKLAPDVLVTSIQLMALSGSARVITGIYRGALAGLERHELLGALQVSGATLKFPGALLFAHFTGGDPVLLFAYLASAQGLELLAFVCLFRRALPIRPKGNASVSAPLAWAEVMPICGAMAALSVLWVVTTQFDRLMLSKTLTLEEYGDYTLVITASSGILVLLPVVNQILQPRLTAVLGMGPDADGEALYRSISQLMCAAFMSLGGSLAIFSEPVLALWTGDPGLASRASSSLFWYALAFSITGFMSVPFMLQFAAGRLRLHLIASTAFALVLAPVMVVAASHGGMRATGFTAFMMNLVFLLGWIPVVHRRFLPGCGVDWYVRDLLPAAGAAVGTLVVAKLLFPEQCGRSVAAFLVALSTLIAFLAALGVSPLGRTLLKRRPGQ